MADLRKTAQTWGDALRKFMDASNRDDELLRVAQANWRTAAISEDKEARKRAEQTIRNLGATKLAEQLADMSPKDARKFAESSVPVRG